MSNKQKRIVMDGHSTKRSRYCPVALMGWAALFALGLAAPFARAVPPSVLPCEIAQIHENEIEDIVSFGRAVAFDGKTVAVSALYVVEPPDPDAIPPIPGEFDGIVRLYEWDGEQWLFQQEFTETGAQKTTGSGFGQALALEEDLLVIGDVTEDLPPLLSAGSVTLYRLNPDSGVWEFEDKVFSAEPQQLGLFGGSVALEGDRLVVQARLEDVEDVQFAGRAYTFTHSDGKWTHEATFDPPEPESDGLAFGKAHAVAGDLIVLGAPSADGPKGAINGAAFLYRRSNGEWKMEQKLLPPDARNSTQNFAAEGALFPDRERVVFGAPNDTPVSNVGLGQIGSLYFFSRQSTGEWVFEDKVYDPDAPGPWANLGFTPMDVTDDGKSVLAGAPGDWENGGLDAGASHVIRYTEDGWVHDGKILASDGGPGQGFGGTRISGNYAMITGGGKVYMFTGIDGLDCTGNGIANACDIHSGEFPDTTGTGIPDICEQSGDLTGDGTVGVADLLILINTWGPCAECEKCPADLSGDCAVGIPDLLILISNWG